MNASNFKIITYNIHKGYSFSSRRHILESIRSAIRNLKVDLVFLQEISGKHKQNHVSQYEYLADQTWNHFTYGKNAIYTHGHHGNAILSHFPIVSSHNEDVSYSKLERRGILHTVLTRPNSNAPLHTFCVHLGLFEKDRKRQIARLGELILKKIPPTEPIIIAGDFNDWRGKSAHALIQHFNFKEAFLESTGAFAKTFPNRIPLLSLDRIYYRGLEFQSAKVLNQDPWKKLSDHLPLIAEFK